MRVKEWHRIMVKGRRVFHDLEPAYYRQGKTNVRIDGMWYCAECDDIVDMRGLTEQGFQRARNLSGKYTSMFEKGLRFERKWRSSEHVVKKVSNVERSLPVGGDSNVSHRIDTERTDIVSHKQKEKYPGEKYPGTPGHWRCPCGSGKKYRDCCRRPKL